MQTEGAEGGKPLHRSDGRKTGREPYRHSTQSKKVATNEDLRKFSLVIRSPAGASKQEILQTGKAFDPHGFPKAWVARMRLSMAELTPRFSTNWMVREYIERLYPPAALAYRERVIPYSLGVAVPLEAARILWQR